MTSNSETKSAPRRTYHSAQERADILQELQASGLSVTEFAAQRGLPLSTVQAWRRKARAIDQPADCSSSQALGAFRQVPLGQVLGANSWSGEIHLSDGTTLRWNGQMSPAVVGQLVDHLRKSC